MRLNIEFVAPWLHGYPIRTWIWHTWRHGKGEGRGKFSAGFVLLGFWFHFTREATWNGISVSINF